MVRKEEKGKDVHYYLDYETLEDIAFIREFLNKKFKVNTDTAAIKAAVKNYADQIRNGQVK
jgi:predicted component of type VI protein secretion system